MKKIGLAVLGILMITACSQQQPSVSSKTADETIQKLVEKNPADSLLIAKGVRQVARLWQVGDGDETAFSQFCIDNYLVDKQEKHLTFLKICRYLESILGHFNELSLQLQREVHEAGDALLPIDEMFAAYSPDAHWVEDFYTNKLAFIIALNFPQLSLDEKEALGDDREKWAYARLGDIFTDRIPAELQQAVAAAASDADVYISQYNIHTGHLLNNGKTLFPKDQILLSHWNLRDEIKANYASGENNLEKQRTIYAVMQRIVAQDIPSQVIHSGDYEWDPFTNTLYQNGETVKANPETAVRYQKLLNNFKAQQALDVYAGKTYIDRNFSDNMEITVDEAERMLEDYLSAPEMQQIGQLIARRLNRTLEPFDIWYDGFKTRSSLNEDGLSEQIRRLYPNVAAFERDIPNLLVRLGFSAERAAYISDKIVVDAARGSGHAWGGSMKGQKAHLRTRIPNDGFDYKGYNIAMHELGHNVEQTISLYDVDYYILNGVPNTAFTEALAFIFQKRDLELLGVKNTEADNADVLDKAWQLYEIGGVSLLDIQIWKWLYAHPKATAEELRDETIRLSKEIWNRYYAPVFGIEDQTILAIYSHSISYPLYLTAYAYGQIIQFQLEEYLKGKNFAAEVDRIYRLGCLTPNCWMKAATGEVVSEKPILVAVRKCL